MNSKEYTPEMAGSGQYGKCAHCKKAPTKEGHDGCLGTLKSDEHDGIMNACCGHGDNDGAYIQYWDGYRIGEEEAAIEIKRLTAKARGE